MNDQPPFDIRWRTKNGTEVGWTGAVTLTEAIAVAKREAPSQAVYATIHRHGRSIKAVGVRR